MNHTPTPWSIADAGTVIGGRDRHIIGEFIELPNARRIVACVNFLEGVAQEKLEEGRTVGDGWLKPMVKAQTQRDALIVAVKAALEYVSSEAVGTAQEEIEENERVREILRAALAKVAAKQPPQSTVK